MSGGKGGGLVHEEEFGVLARLEEFSTPALELQFTDDPPLDLPLAHELASVVVEQPAVPEPSTAVGDGVAGSERIDTVWEWHRRFIPTGSHSIDKYT